MRKGTKKIGIIGSGSSIGSAIAMVMAMADTAIPCHAEPEWAQPPKVCLAHERHQGSKERARRLKRLAAEEE